MKLRNLKFSWLLFVGTLVVLFVAGCGSGGGSSSADTSATISGKAVLGPLSGATINIVGLDGSLIGTVVAQETSDLATAGSFTLVIEALELPDIVIVIASGGIDVDPEDDGLSDSEINNKGAVHAYLTRAQLLDGNFIVNPLTEIVYQEIAFLYPNGVEGLAAEEFSVLLDEVSNKYLIGEKGYEGALNFLPFRDKGTSKIEWDLVLKKFVKGIHEGEFDADMCNRVAFLEFYLRDEGIATSTDGTRIERLDDSSGDRVKTLITVDDNELVGVLEQQYVDDGGAMISLRVERMTDTQSFILASISKAGHVLEFKGVTSLLDGVPFTEASITSFVSKLVSIGSDDAEGIQLVIDKSLSSRISDNEINFTIDGREPKAEELAVVLDDPEVFWKWSVTDLFSSSEVLTGITATIQGCKIEDMILYENGSLLLEMDLVNYKKFSGLAESGKDLFVKGVTNVIIDTSIFAAGAITANPVVAAAGAISAVSDVFYIVTDAIPQGLELYMTSTRIELYGKTDAGKIIPGEKYTPILFLKNDKADTVYDLGLSISYSEWIGDSSTSIFSENYIDDVGYSRPVVRKYPMGSFKAKKDKCYMLIPSNQISIFMDKDSANFSYYDIVGDGVDPLPFFVTMKTTTDKWTYFPRPNTITVSRSENKFFVDFNYIEDGGSLYLDASSSVSNDGTIVSYLWEYDGEQIATGRTAVVPVSGLDSNGTLKLTARNLSGGTGVAQKAITLTEESWRKPNLVTYEIVDSNLSQCIEETGLPWDEITRLDCAGDEISNLEGIQNLINLEMLQLDYCQISDVTPLRGLTKIRSLGLSENQISDISPLRNLTDLNFLNLYNNLISDISALQNMTNLTFLSLATNKISDVSLLSRFDKLEDLYLSYNCITDLSPVSHVPNLDAEPQNLSCE